MDGWFGWLIGWLVDLTLISCNTNAGSEALRLAKKDPSIFEEVIETQIPCSRN